MNKKNQTNYIISLILIGFLAKIISLVSKILMTRTLGVEAMGLFSLVNPLLVLIIALSNLSLPSAVASLVSRFPKKEKGIFISALLIVVFLSLSLVLLVLIFSDFIAESLLKNQDTLYCLYASILMIPLTSISAIIKGYFLGKGEIRLTSLSQVFEETGRLLFIIISIFTLMDNTSSPLKASLAIFSLSLGEIFQMGYMIFFCKKEYKNDFLNYVKDFDLKYQSETKELLNISLPLTLSRLVGSLTYCLEPIIFTNLMLRNGFTTMDVTLSYGILTGYVMPILLMPGFLSVALSNFLLPNMGKLIGNNELTKAKKLLIQISSYCLLIGFFISIIYFLFPSQILYLIYGTNEGSIYVKYLCFPFIIYYIEGPIISGMNVLGISKKSFYSTVVSSIIRIILLLILVPYLKIIAVAISTMISVFIDVLMNIFFINRFFKRNNIKIIN